MLQAHTEDGTRKEAPARPGNQTHEGESDGEGASLSTSAHAETATPAAGEPEADRESEAGRESEAEDLLKEVTLEVCNDYGCSYHALWSEFCVGDRDNCFLPTQRLHLKKCLKGRCCQQS